MNLHNQLLELQKKLAEKNKILNQFYRHDTEEFQSRENLVMDFLSNDIEIEDFPCNEIRSYTSIVHL